MYIFDVSLRYMVIHVFTGIYFLSDGHYIHE